MSSFANTQAAQGGVASVSVTETQTHRSWLQRIRDWLWGYDFFVSYHWASGGPYAVNLAQRLRDAKYDVFLDRAEYAMGDDWKKVGAYALSNTQRLILVATKEAVTESAPVEREVQLFTDKNRQVIPIVFGDDLQKLDWKKLEVLSRMEDSMLRISEDVHNLASGPSDAAIDQLVKTHGLMRRRTLRRWIISVLITLISVSALIAGFQWQVAAEEARKANLQLAKNYMRQGIDERDNKEDLYKAAYYMLKAAEIGDKAKDPRLSINGRIAGAETMRRLPNELVQLNDSRDINRPFFSQSQKWVFDWNKNGTRRIWDSRTGELLQNPTVQEDLRKGWRKTAPLSRDENRVLTWSEDGTVRIQDSRTGELLVGPMAHEKSITYARYFQDEQWVLTLTEDGTARVWDSHTGEPLSASLNHGDKNIRIILFSKDKLRVLTNTYDRAGRLHIYTSTTRVWDNHTGELLSTIKHGQITNIKFSEDGQKLLIRITDGGISLWDIHNSQYLSTPISREKKLKSARFSQDGLRVLTTTTGGMVQLWDSRNGELLSERQIHSKEIKGADFSQDGQRVLIWTTGGMVQLWDSRNGEMLSERLIHSKAIEGHRFSQDGQRILTWSNDGTARVWNISNDESISVPMVHNKEVNGALFSQDELRVLTFSKDGTARVWDSRTGQPISAPMEHLREISNARFIQNDQWVETRTSGLSLPHIWDSFTGELLFTPMEHKDMKYSESKLDTRYSQDGQLALTWGDRGAWVWGSRTNTSLVARMEHKDGVKGALTSRDEQRLLTWSGDGSARIWDSHTGEPISAAMKQKGNIRGARFSRDELWVLTWGGESIKPTGHLGTARVWDSRTGEPLSAPMVHKKEIIGAKFSPDEQQVLTWGRWGARIWGINTGKSLLPKPIADNWFKVTVKGALLSQDGQHVLTWGQKQILLTKSETVTAVWDSHTGQQILENDEDKKGANSYRFNLDEHLILVWDLDGAARVWDSRNGKPLSKLMTHKEWARMGHFSQDKQEFSVPIPKKEHIKGTQFSQNGQRVLAWGLGGASRVYDSLTGVPLSKPMRGKQRVMGARFSSDEHRVFTWGRDGTIRIWDSHTGEPLIITLGHEMEVTIKDLIEPLFVEDGQRVISWDPDGIGRIGDLSADFDFPSQLLIQQLEIKTRRKVTEVGDVEKLTSEEWNQRWSLYERLAWGHLKECKYPQANWYLDRMIHLPGSCQSPGKWLEHVNKEKLDEVKQMYVRVCVEQGRKLFTEQHYKQSKIRFDTALILQPKLAAAYEGLARALIESGEDPDKGIKLVEKSLQLNPYQAPKYGLATLVKGYAATAQDKKLAQNTLKLAQTYLVWQEYQSAIDEYSETFSLDPELLEQHDQGEYTKVLMNLPKFIQNKKHYEAVNVIFEKALKDGLTEEKLIAQWANEMAEVLIHRYIDIDQGIAYANRSLELYPSQSPKLALNTLAQGYIKQGQNDKVVILLEKALKNTRKTASDSATVRGVLNDTLKQARTAQKKALKKNREQTRSTKEVTSEGKSDTIQPKASQ